MKKLFILTFITTFWCNFNYSQYVELRGTLASNMISGAEHIRYNEAQQLPWFVVFHPEKRPHITEWEKTAINFLKDKSGQDHFRWYRTDADNLGWMHYRYVQIHNGYPVEGSMIIVHTIDNKVISWNGEYYSGLPGLHHEPALEGEALKSALNQYPAEIYMWQNPLQEEFLKKEQGNESATFFPTGELVYKNESNAYSSVNFKLCWKFNIYAQQPLKRGDVYIDATNLALVDVENLLHTGNVTGIAETKYSGKRNIYTDSTTSTSYRLRQTVLGKGVETYNMQKSTSYTSTDFTDNDNYWNNANANKDEVATDAHFGAEQTYIYYRNHHDRKSYDNNDSKLRSYVHYSNNYDNAFWDGQRMTYGDGNVLRPLTCIDVAAHEMSHGVTSNSSKLVYNGESGALNESFSDIFGSCVEYDVRGVNADWAIGAEITTSNNGIRNMKNPALFSDPGAYLDNNWYTGSADNGGVHTNSGVQNHWFYILVTGENGVNFKGNSYTVTGLGYDTAGAIAYRNNAFYLTPNSKYIDSRFYSIQAAKDLYGVCHTAVKQTTNAWYAVNVGLQFDTVLHADFYADPSIICAINDTAVFYNTSSNVSSSWWDFGDGSNSSQTNPKHKYNSFGNYNIKLKVQGCQGGNDSIIRNAYIQVDSSLGYCKAYKIPVSGSGGTYTACSGTLKDNGGDKNYSDNSDGYVTIAPTNSSYIQLTFSQFNMENPGDYLYIYEGAGTGGTLIGRYSGSSLPNNNGVIYSSTGTITVRQVSDPGLNYSGFVLDWKCFPKVSNDVGVTSIINLNGRENTSISLNQNTDIRVRVKNYGNNTVSNIPVYYRLNGGNVVSETLAGPVTSGTIVSYTFSSKADMATTGYYTIEAWTDLSGDSINTANNKTTSTIKHIKNQPVILPYFQDFEANANISLQSSVIGIDSTDEYDYSNTRPDNGRLRSAAGAGFYNSGQRAITFDQIPATGSSGPYNTNLLKLTLNMSNYTTSKNIYLDFSFMPHGDETIDSDKVWVRGNDQANWIQLYNMQSGSPAIGAYKQITSLNISTALSNAGQNYSSSFQVLFGQKNNGTASTPSGNDGLSIDDIYIWTEIRDIGVSRIVSPVTGCGLSDTETVVAEIYNYGTNLTNRAGKIYYKLNNGTVLSNNVNFNVSRNQFQQFTLSGKLDLKTPGSYIIKMWTELNGDTVKTNDTINENIISYPPIVPLQVSESGPLTFCQGDSVILTANSGYVSYNWSNGNTAPSVTIKQPGTYTLTVKNSNGCEAKYSATIIVNYKPIVGFNWAINKNTVTFTNLTSGATSFKWYFGDGDSSTVLNPVHTYMQTGTYAVQLDAFNNCGFRSDKYNININALGIQSVVSENIYIFPNPATEYMNIYTNIPSRFEIINKVGQIIYTGFMKTGMTEISLKEFKKGLYILKDSNGNVLPFIVQ